MAYAAHEAPDTKTWAWQQCAHVCALDQRQYTTNTPRPTPPTFALFVRLFEKLAAHACAPRLGVVCLFV